MRDNYSQSVVVDGRQHVISIELRVETECIWITEVKTPVEIRSQGYARRTLEALIADADIESITLRLVVGPYDDGLDYLQLVTFYESLGFVHQGLAFYIRKPNAKRTS